MSILWRQGIKYDNVLLFSSDAATYMLKAKQAFSVVYPKITHFTCGRRMYVFHPSAEAVRGNNRELHLLTSSVKKSIS